MSEWRTIMNEQEVKRMRAENALHVAVITLLSGWLSERDVITTASDYVEHAVKTVLANKKDSPTPISTDQPTGERFQVLPVVADVPGEAPADGKAVTPSDIEDARRAWFKIFPLEPLPSATRDGAFKKEIKTIDAFFKRDAPAPIKKEDEKLKSENLKLLEFMHDMSPDNIPVQKLDGKLHLVPNAKLRAEILGETLVKDAPAPMPDRAVNNGNAAFRPSPVGPSGGNAGREPETMRFGKSTRDASEFPGKMRELRARSKMFKGKMDGGKEDR
jgi:hypothetical protein